MSLKKELIVAVCDESLAAVAKQAHLYDHVTIYDKCGAGHVQKAVEQMPNASVQRLRNVGSCDHAFLTYIVDNYDKLPDEMEFLKASSVPDGTKGPTSCENCSAAFRSLDYLNTGIKDWHFHNNPRRRYGQYAYKRTGYPNMRTWIEKKSPLTMRNHLETPCAQKFWGGHFTATSEQVRNSPRSYYATLRKQQKYPNAEVDHFIERSWGPLFCAPRNIEK